ncbi:hypothetical protein N0824_01925 [Microcystis sp. 0824]|nr:hypothetical protein N0824_01925 [Microcystis sp. 0824]
MGIYAPLQKLFALKCEVLDPIFSIKITEIQASDRVKIYIQFENIEEKTKFF